MLDIFTELPGERLKGRTILSIAYQINTVIDSDLIMTIYYGTVSEMGALWELLGGRGMFSAVVPGEVNIEGWLDWSQQRPWL